SVVSSNVTRADYAGSASCAACHGGIYQAWQHSPMHRMTRQLDETEIRAPFDGTQFRLGRDSAFVEQQAGERFLKLEGPEGVRRYRVSKVIGGRYREDFVGVEVAGEAGRERVLPLSFVFSTSSWRYKGYSVMLPERPALRAGPVWAATCIG